MSDGGGVLTGVRVLDLSRVIAGPLAARILADLGADVLKIEAPGEGDPARGYSSLGGVAGISPTYVTFNHGKRTTVIDLKSEAGRSEFMRLAASADVLVHNFRPAAAERLGIGYDQLAAVNPRLVYCAISGFGEDGPFADKAANDVIIQAYSGLMSMTGEADGPPVRCGFPTADCTTGLFAAIGVLGALFERTSSGRGQAVRTSLFESQLNVLGQAFAEYALSGLAPRRMGSATRVGLPNAAFPTSDGSVVIAAISERMWQRLCAALGQPELATDPRFATLDGRRANDVVLNQTVSAMTARLTTDDCVAALDAEGVACAPIRTVDEAAASPEFAALDMWRPVPVASGEVKVLRGPLRFSRSGREDGAPERTCERAGETTCQ